MVTRWRVRFSTRRPGWVYFAHVAFVDALTPAQAAAAVEQAHTNVEATAEAWETLPATEAMELAHVALESRRAEWLRRVKAGENPRGLL